MDALTLSEQLGGRRNGQGYVALCPAHDDRSPSLSIKDGDNGRPLVHCFAGCDQEAVIAALRDKDLWPARLRDAAHDSAVATARRIEREPSRHLGSHGPALVDKILERSGDAWIPLVVGGITLMEIPPGGHVVLDAPTGHGKTALAAGILAEHARAQGPAVYVSLELRPEDVAARVIAAHVPAPWDHVLRGRTKREEMLDAIPERMTFASDLAALPQLVADARVGYRGEPVLVCVDYLQLAAIGDDMRTGVAQAAEWLRVLGERERVAMLLVSQPSRAAARDLRSGEISGAQTVGVSAESAQVERGATATLAIGGMAAPDEHGWARADLSVGKGRFGGGDRVWPALFQGAHGRWRLEGEAKSGAEVRAIRAEQHEATRVSAARLAIQAAVGRATEPMTGRELRQAAGCSSAVATAAISAAVEAGEISVHPPRSRSTHPTYGPCTDLAPTLHRATTSTLHPPPKGRCTVEGDENEEDDR